MSKAIRLWWPCPFIARVQPQANAMYAILPAAVPPASHHPIACLLPATMPCVGPLFLGPHGRPITAATQCNCCGNRQTALLRCFSGILSPPGKRFHLRLSLQSFCISAVGFQYVPFDIAIWPVLHHRTGRFARPYGPSCAQARLAALPRAAPVVCRHAARLPSRR